MNKHFKLFILSKIPAKSQHVTLTITTSVNMTSIAATKIIKDILLIQLLALNRIKAFHYPQNCNTDQGKR